MVKALPSLAAKAKGVPMGRIPWNIGEPGHFEVDLVHHSGEESAGLYGHTIQLIDVFIRCIRGWHLGHSLDQSLTLRALEQALAHHTPETHHSEEILPGHADLSLTLCTQLQQAGCRESG